MKYFSQWDFDNATPKCQMDDMDKAFLEKLDNARGKAGIPFYINSAYRSIDYEESQGRSGTSSHTEGLAVDIEATNSRERFLILKSLIDVGFHRIGIGKNFIHVDADSEKDKDVVWHYYE